MDTAAVMTTVVPSVAESIARKLSSRPFENAAQPPRIRVLARLLCYPKISMRTLCIVLLVVAACNSKPSAPSGAPPSAPGAAKDVPADPSCGTRPTDWCASPPGDPCGEHKDVESCKADPKCVGMPYRGESAVVCEYDARVFGKNCPTVGCRSPGT